MTRVPSAGPRSRSSRRSPGCGPRSSAARARWVAVTSILGDAAVPRRRRRGARRDGAPDARSHRRARGRPARSSRERGRGRLARRRRAAPGSMPSSPLATRRSAGWRRPSDVAACGRLAALRRGGPRQRRDPPRRRRLHDHARQLAPIRGGSEHGDRARHPPHRVGPRRRGSWPSTCWPATSATLLFDTGMASTPAEVIAPYLESIGSALEPIDDRAHQPRRPRPLRRQPAAARAATRRRCFACHELDRRWIESNDAMVARELPVARAVRLRRSRTQGARPSCSAACGGDAPIDDGLQGGETIATRYDDWRVEVLHLPGHTLGHLGIWDPRSRAAIIIDAALDDGIYDRAGNKLIPPRYYDLTPTAQTIRGCSPLEPGAPPHGALRPARGRRRPRVARAQPSLRR